MRRQNGLREAGEWWLEGDVDAGWLITAPTPDICMKVKWILLDWGIQETSVA